MRLVVLVLVLLSSPWHTAGIDINDVLFFAPRRSCAFDKQWFGYLISGGIVSDPPNSNMRTILCVPSSDLSLGVFVYAQGWSPTSCRNPRLYMLVSSYTNCLYGVGTVIELTGRQCIDFGGWTFLYGWSGFTEAEVCAMLTYRYYYNNGKRIALGRWTASPVCNPRHVADKYEYTLSEYNPAVSACAPSCPAQAAGPGNICCQATMMSVATGRCTVIPGFYVNQYITCSGGAVYFAERVSPSNTCNVLSTWHVFRFNQCVQRGSQASLMYVNLIPEGVVCNVVEVLARHGFAFNNHIPLSPSVFAQALQAHGIPWGSTPPTPPPSPPTTPPPTPPTTPPPSPPTTPPPTPPTTPPPTPPTTPPPSPPTTPPPSPPTTPPPSPPTTPQPTPSTTPQPTPHTTPPPIPPTPPTPPTPSQPTPPTPRTPTLFVSGVFKKGDCRAFLEHEGHVKGLEEAVLVATEAVRLVRMDTGCSSVVFSAEVEAQRNLSEGEVSGALTRALAEPRHARLREVLQTVDTIAVTSSRPTGNCSTEHSDTVSIDGKCVVVSCRDGYTLQWSSQHGSSRQCVKDASGDSGLSTAVLIGAICGGVALLVIVVVAVLCCCRRSKTDRNVEQGKALRKKSTEPVPE